MRSSPFNHRHLLCVLRQVSGILVKRLVVSWELRVPKQGIVFFAYLYDLSYLLLNRVFFLLVVLFVVLIILTHPSPHSIFVIVTSSIWRVSHLMIVVIHMFSFYLNFLAKLSLPVIIFVLFRRFLRLTVILVLRLAHSFSFCLYSWFVLLVTVLLVNLLPIFLLIIHFISYNLLFAR